MKVCICHFTTWQIHPFISKVTMYVHLSSPDHALQELRSDPPYFLSEWWSGDKSNDVTPWRVSLFKKGHAQHPLLANTERQVHAVRPVAPHSTGTWQPANTMRGSNAGSMLGQRRRRWSSIKTALGRTLLFSCQLELKTRTQAKWAVIAMLGKLALPWNKKTDPYLNLGWAASPMTAAI